MTNRWVNPINNNILRDLQNNVLASGSVAFYEAGTSTPLAVYSDPELTVSLGSYIDADAYGLLPDFHLAAGTQYKAVAYDAIGGAGGSGAVKWTRDDVFGADSSVDTRLDALESTVSEISASSNALVNGGMRVTSGVATTLTTSYLEGAVFGTYGKVANVTAGTLTQAQDDDYASGYVSIFSGVSTDNAAATVDTQFRIQSKDSFQFMNGNGVFSAYVEHDVGSSVNYTITVSVANAADDFSSVTNVLVGSATAVANATRTQITLPVEGLGDCSNGIAITISAACGVVTTKNFKIGEAQFESGLAATGFTELPYDIEQAALALDVILAQRIVWIGATQLGSSLSVTSAGVPALCAMSPTLLAFIDSANEQLRAYSWNGSAWSLSGTPASTFSSAPAITALSATRIALFDTAPNTLRAVDWDGSNWSVVGSALTISTPGAPYLTAISSTQVAFIDATNAELRTYEFDGANWSLSGSGLSLSSIGNPSITAINSTDVAFVDDTNDELRTYRWDGSTWAQIGSSLSVPGIGKAAIASLNKNDIAFIDTTLELLRVYRWNGASWSSNGYGMPIASIGPTPCLAAINGTDVAYFDGGNDELRTYRFSYYIGEGPFSAANSFSS